jgi:hypothetical protein
MSLSENTRRVKKGSVRTRDNVCGDVDLDDQDLLVEKLLTHLQYRYR